MMARKLAGTTRARTEMSPSGRGGVTTPTAPRRTPEPDPDPTGEVRVVVDGHGADGTEGRDWRDAAGAGDAGAVVGADASAGGGGGGRRRLVPKPGEGDRAKLDLRNTWQVVAGSILVPVGIAIILVAWYGSAHTRYVQQQIPYLVSGSFIGLGCMVLGGLLYWAHWLYRIYDQADLNHEELMKAFEHTLRVVADRLTAPGAGPVAGADRERDPGPGAVVGAGSPSTYVATATGAVYHLPSCPVVAHHGEGLRALGPDALAAMEPCRICLAPGSAGPR
jgi:hypothetical protein